jgi:hypothetical protein
VVKEKMMLQHWFDAWEQTKWWWETMNEQD